MTQQWQMIEHMVIMDNCTDGCLLSGFSIYLIVLFFLFYFSLALHFLKQDVVFVKFVLYICDQSVNSDCLFHQICWNSFKVLFGLHISFETELQDFRLHFTIWLYWNVLWSFILHFCSFDSANILNSLINLPRLLRLEADYPCGSRRPSLSISLWCVLKQISLSLLVT